MLAAIAGIPRVVAARTLTLPIGASRPDVCSSSFRAVALVEGHSRREDEECPGPACAQRPTPPGEIPDWTEALRVGSGPGACGVGSESGRALAPGPECSGQCETYRCRACSATLCGRVAPSVPKLRPPEDVASLARAPARRGPARPACARTTRLSSRGAMYRAFWRIAIVEPPVRCRWPRSRVQPIGWRHSSTAIRAKQPCAAEGREHLDATRSELRSALGQFSGPRRRRRLDAADSQRAVTPMPIAESGGVEHAGCPDCDGRAPGLRQAPGGAPPSSRLG